MGICFPFIIRLLIFSLIVLAYHVDCQSAGWKMTDRFYGFRYELQADLLETSLESSIQSQADSMGCFGWVQRYKENEKIVVGEVRCSKDRGVVVQSWLKSLVGDGNARFLVRFVLLITHREVSFFV